MILPIIIVRGVFLCAQRVKGESDIVSRTYIRQYTGCKQAPCFIQVECHIHVPALHRLVVFAFMNSE